MIGSAGDAAADAPSQRGRGQRRRMVALVALVLTTIVGTLPLDVDPVSAASRGPGAAAPLEPIRFVLDDTGFTPSATSAARGQTIWIDNASSTPRTVTIGGPTLTSGPIPAGGRFVTSLPIGGTFALTDDAATPNEATLTIGLPVLPGSPTQNAIAQIPDQVPPPAPLDQHPDLTLYLSRSRVLVAPTAIASVGQINDALTANGLIIVGGIRAGEMLVTEPAGSAGPTDVVALQAIIDDLRSRPGIRSAAYEFALASTAALPRPVNPDPTVGLAVRPDTEYRNWEVVVDSNGGATGIGSNYGLEASRFPQVWNLLDETRRRSPSGPSTDTVVIDVGFDLSHPDLTGAELELLCTQGNTYCSTNRIDPTTGLPASGHGNAVAATIGAPFDRGDPSSRTSVGVVGGNPTTDLHLVPANSARLDTQFLGFFDYLQTFHLVFDRRPTDFPQLRTINLSLGSVFLDDGLDWNRRWATTSCGPGFADDASTPTASRVACTPNTLDAYLVEIRALAEFTRPAAERALGANVAIVTSAGNQSRQICDVVRAAPTDFCPTTTVIDAPNVKPLAWIDSTWSGSRGSPILVVEAYDFDNRRSGYSNRGTISAPGTLVAPLVRPDGSPGYQVTQGTSFASPFVAAAVGYLASLAPTAQVENLVAALKTRGRADIDGTTTPRLDVFEAAVTLPGVLERLLDVNGPLTDGNDRIVYGNDGVSLGPDTARASATPGGPRFSAPDGRIDLRDFRVFRDAFLDSCRRSAIPLSGCPPRDLITLDGDTFHPKFDTNLDGCIAGEGVVGCDRSELLFSRLDFNGDGLLSDGAVRFPLTATGQIAPPGTGTPMDDLDVFASRWGTGAGADTGGYAAGDLRRLLVSGDVEVRLDQLWAEGATRAEVYVTSSAEPANSRTFVATPPTSTNQIPWRSVTVPLDSTAAVDNFVQVRVVADMPERADPAIFLSPFIDLGIGGDAIVTPCANQLTLTADPEVPDPGGSSTITARLIDCLGNGVTGQELAFEIAEGPDGSSISRVTATTDADGVATTVFDMPLRTIAPARVTATAYPALAGEPLQGFVNLGDEFIEEPGVTVYFNSREIIEDYERVSSNDWGDDADDCDGPIDATGSPAGCFFSTQRFAFPDSIDVNPGVIAIDRRGLISLGFGVGDASITTETRIFGGPESPDPIPGESYDFVPLVTNVLEWPAGNIGAAENKEIFSNISITSIGQSGMDWSTLATTPLPAVTHTLDGSGLRVFGLSSFNDDFYFSSTRHSADNFYPDLHPDVPVGQALFPEILRHRQQIPTQLALLERIDGTAFPFAADIDGPLTVRRSADGSFDTYTYCARNDRSLSGGGGYWSDASPLRAWGRDPDDQRFEREPGDRAAPLHSGYVRGKVSFVAVVSLDGTPPPPGALDAPPCEPEGLNANFTVSPAAPQEGRVVRFSPPAGRLGENDALEYLWIFGDGNESTEASPEHVYEDSGDYIVTLLVEDPEGGTGVASRQITVANTPPNLWIDAVRPTAGGAELDITIGEWSVVDGLGVTVVITGNGQFPTIPAAPYPVGSHTIPLGDIVPGTYNVVVTAIDKDGAAATRNLQLAVSAATPSGGSSPIQPFASQAATAANEESGPTEPPVSGLRSAMTGLVAQASPGDDPFTSVAVPAFVLSRVTATTDDTIEIRNASISGGALVGTVFDLGDGRTTIPIDAGATRPVNYGAAIDAVVSTMVAGTAAHADLIVTGAAVVPVVAVGPASATTGFVGQSVVVRASVTAQASGTPLAGRPVTFRVGTATVDAVSDIAGVAEALLTVAGPAGVGELEVAVASTDSDSGATASAPFTVLANSPPTASAGGPYEVPILGDLVLDATGTDADPEDAGALGFAWDLDGDGDFDDATGPQPLIAAASVAAVVCGGTCGADQVDEITVRVTDTKGVATTASTTVRSVADFTLGLSSGVAALGPGQQASIRVDVRTFNGFDGLVTLSAPSLPTGVVATFSPSSVRPNGESVLTLRASDTASPTTDPVPLIVRGTSGGVVRETTGAIDVEFALVPRCTGSVTGVVTNAATGAPVGEGVLVRIGIVGAFTDADGRYTVSEIVVAADNGPRIYDVTATAVPGEPPFLSEGRSIFVHCVTTTFDFAVTPERYGTVTGTVRFADAAGVVTPFVPPTTGSTPQVQLSTRTGNRSAPLDAQGRYRFDNVPLNVPNLPTPASPRIQFTGRHLAQATATVRGGEETVIDLVATQVCTGSIRVRVIDGITGLTRAGARVRYGSNPLQTADANGIVLLTGVPLGAPDNRAINHSVTAFGPVGDNRSATTTARLPRCGATTPVDVRLPVPTTPTSATLRATIVDDETNLPVPGLTLRTSNGATSPTSSGPDGIVSWVISLGTATSANVVASTANTTDYYPSATQNVLLTAGQTRNVTFRVLKRKFGVITGTVTDAFTGAPLAGVPVNDGLANTTTDENGRYELAGLPLNAGNQPAQRSVRARPDAQLYWERTVTTTVAAAPPATTVDFALVPVCRGATVRGRVISAVSGQPIEGAAVNIAGEQQTTGADGLFAFTDLRVGSQNTPATWGISAAAPGFVTASRTVTIFCGADIVVDFGAPNTNATIEGRVTDEGGDPVSGVFVGTGFGGSAITDGNGEYRIVNAPAPLDGTEREWTVSFQPAAGSGLQNATGTATVRAGETVVVNATLLASNGEPPNQRPTAVVAGPPTAVEGDTVTLTAAGSSDADGTITTVQWDLDGDGTFETTAAGVASEVTVTRADDASVAVGLRVTDDDGASATTTHTVRFANAPPVITLADDLVVDGARVTRTGSVADVGTADTHTATVSRGDGTDPVPLALTPDGPGRYTFALDLEYTTPGTRTVAVTVCDDDHAPGAQPPIDGCDTETFQVTIVLPNRPPVATPGTLSTRANRSVAITLAGTDPDGDDLTAVVVDEPTNGTLTGTPPNLEYTPNLDYVGPDRLTFTVSDGESTSAPAEIAITVSAGNVAPTAVVAGATTAVEGETVTLTAVGSDDVDGTIALVEWDLDDDGSFETAVGSVDTPVTVTRRDDGEITVGLQVTDDEGAVGTTSHVVRFDNAVPVITLSDDLTVADGRLTRSGVIADAGLDDTHEAIIDVDTGDAVAAQPLTLVPDGPGRYTFAIDHTYLAPGQRTVSITVCDDDHDPTAEPPVDGCATSTFVVDIPPPRVNQEPVAVITGPTSALEGETVVLSAEASSDDRTIVSYAWDIGDDGTTDGTGTTVPVTARNDGSITVALEVTDDEGATASTIHLVTYRDVAAQIVLGGDLVIGDDGTVTRSGRIVDPGPDDVHVVTVDWGDGSSVETIAIDDRSFQLRHRYGSGAGSLLGSLGRDAALQASYVVVVTACDVAVPAACGTSTFEVGPTPAPSAADLGVSVRSIDAVAPGQRTTVGVTVTNAGPSPAVDVVVTLTLPLGTSTPGLEADGWRCGASDLLGAVRCAPLASELPVGAWALSLPVDVGVAAPTRLVFEASVQSATNDPTSANNQATGSADVMTVVPTNPVATPAATPAVTPTITAPESPALPSGGLPATGSSGVALQLQLAALAAALGLTLRLTGRRRRRS